VEASLEEILSTLNARKAELDALRPLPPDVVQRVAQKLRLEWNYHSNALEGNQLSLSETQLLLMHGLTAKGKPLKDHLDIQGHNEAIEYLEELAKEDARLTHQLVKELHRLILKESYAAEAETPDGQRVKRQVKIGEYKTEPNHVKTQTGEIFRYVEPHFVQSTMADLLDCLEREMAEKDGLHPLELAVWFHYAFVRIHPLTMEMGAWPAC